MSEKLLPPRSGPWTRAVAYTMDTNRRISYATVKIKTIGITDFPEDWLPWLIYEYGLEEVVPYVRTLRQALVEGRVWQKRRGTPDGIRIGIGWVESEGQVAPPDGRHSWWQFQVAFSEPPKDLEQIRQLYGIINLSKASEDELFRMFSPGYDLRPVRMDEHRYDDGIMDDYSGAPQWEDGPYISFGVDETHVLEWDIRISGASQTDTGLVFDWFDGTQLDLSLADEDLVRGPFSGNFSFEGTRLEAVDAKASSTVTRRDTASFLVSYGEDSWGDRYPAGTWSDPVEPYALTTPLETS